MKDFDFVNTTLALMKDWYSKYNQDVKNSFVELIKSKNLETHLYEEIFMRERPLDLALKNVCCLTNADKSDVEIALRFLLIDWSKFVNGGVS